MALIGLQEVTVKFGGPPLLDAVTVQIEVGERVCLLGRNGAGKSTFLKLLDGEYSPDTGEMVRQQGLRVSRLPQDLPPAGAWAGQTVFDVVARERGKLGQSLSDYHRLHLQPDADSPANADEHHRLQHILDTKGGWALQQRVEAAISRVELDPDMPADTLSGGQQRKVLLASALAAEPDILLLDEPTNHLDLEAITWLESFLPRAVKTLVFITHDRVFLQKLATRILEIDRGQVTDWACDYPTYLKRRQQLLDAEDTHNALFDKKLAQEEAWLRKGVKARRTRNEGRVRALESMRKTRASRRERSGQVNLEMETGSRSGALIVKAENVDFGYGPAEAKPIVRDLTTTIMRGDKLGIVGPNGAGKTTLLRGLLGELPARCGKLQTGTNLQIAYFDQMRSELDPTRTLVDTISDGHESVTINGKSRHVMGYLQDFLFSPDRARSPVSVLSGGERNRLVLARLFTQPANMLVLDEPTNDLDMETLELLEELLVTFEGTVLLVSHDRAFLDNVVGGTLAYEGDGRFQEYVGGYQDYLRQRAALAEARSVAASKSANTASSTSATGSAATSAAPSATPVKAAPKGKRLSFKEQKELEELPGRIEACETRLAAMHAAMADPELYRRGSDAVLKAKTDLATAEKDLETAFTRWTDLEARA